MAYQERTRVRGEKPKGRPTGSANRKKPSGNHEERAGVMQKQRQASLKVLFLYYWVGFAGFNGLLGLLLHHIKTWDYYIVAGLAFASVMTLFQKYLLNR